MQKTVLKRYLALLFLGHYFAIFICLAAQERKDRKRVLVNESQKKKNTLILALVNHRNQGQNASYLSTKCLKEDFYSR